MNPDNLHLKNIQFFTIAQQQQQQQQANEIKGALLNPKGT